MNQRSHNVEKVHIWIMLMAADGYCDSGDICDN